MTFLAEISVFRLLNVFYYLHYNFHRINMHEHFISKRKANSTMILYLLGKKHLHPQNYRHSQHIFVEFTTEKKLFL